MKRMSTSVSDFYKTNVDIHNGEKKTETDIEIHFRLLRSGCRHP